ncbi:MAG: chalcone isomerase family protein [Deltaproteobacteria bacterium]
MKNAWVLGLALSLVPSLAFASKREGVSMKDAAKVGGKKVVLNGMGVRQATVFNVNVYVAGLYLEAKTRDPAEVTKDGAKKILFHFVRDVDLDDLQDAFEEGFAKNGGGALKDRVKKLNAMMSDMKDGQRMSLEYAPGTGTTVFVLGKKKGVIPGEDFMKVLFTIFVGPKAPNRLLRDGMLGKA